MKCDPTTPGDGRWTCETCGADLGTSEGKAAPDFARCPALARGNDCDDGNTGEATADEH